MDDACKNRNTQYAGAGAQGKKKKMKDVLLLSVVL